MENDKKGGVERRRRASPGDYAEAADHLTDEELRGNLFYLPVLSTLRYAAETCAKTAATSKSLRTTHRGDVF